jgi:hypothetical protein
MSVPAIKDAIAFVTMPGEYPVLVARQVCEFMFIRSQQVFPSAPQIVPSSISTRAPVAGCTIVEIPVSIFVRANPASKVSASFSTAAWDAVIAA